MPEFLQQLDVSLFYFINTGLQNPFFDWFMPFITEKTHWFPVWVAVIVFLIWKGGREGRIVVLMIIPLIFMSDQLSAQVLKPWIARTRPCVELQNVHLLVKLTTSYSFPSAHAANFFALGTFFAMVYPRFKWWFIGIALVVGLSRIFVGVHYPSDVLGGAVLGALCAVVVFVAWQRLNTYLSLKKKQATLRN